MFGLMKLIPLLLMVAGSAAATDKLKPLLNYTKVVATQVEVNEISRMMTLDAIVNPEQVPAPESFADYLRHNLKAGKDVKRDLAADLWGTPYRLERQGNEVTVRSAGPDAAFATGDDIYARKALR